MKFELSILWCTLHHLVIIL